MLKRYKLIIEPKYPELLSPEEILNVPFYHITHKDNLKKIGKIGLSPRDSTTAFTHPGGRIYLIQTNKISTLYELRKELAKHKSYVTKKPMAEYDKDWTIENMIPLKVSIPVGIKLYKDPMFPVGPDHNAVFTTSNIGPEYITFPK
jgi:hypothetical protein